MKKYLLVSVFAIWFATPAHAQDIGIFEYETGYGCSLPTGLHSSANVVLRAYRGTTGARFRIEPPVGSSIVAFNTPYITIGSLGDDLSIAFGQCIDNASLVRLGTITALWTSGDAWVRPAIGQTEILMTDCSFIEVPIDGCVAHFGSEGIVNCCAGDIVGAESSTWGRVKSLYR